MPPWRHHRPGGDRNEKNWCIEEVVRTGTRARTARKPASRICSWSWTAPSSAVHFRSDLVAKIYPVDSGGVGINRPKSGPFLRQVVGLWRGLPAVFPHRRSKEIPTRWNSGNSIHRIERWRDFSGQSRDISGVIIDDLFCYW